MIRVHMYAVPLSSSQDNEQDVPDQEEEEALALLGGEDPLLAWDAAGRCKSELGSQPAARDPEGGDAHNDCAIATADLLACALDEIHAQGGERDVRTETILKRRLEELSREKKAKATPLGRELIARGDEARAAAAKARSQRREESRALAQLKEAKKIADAEAGAAKASSKEEAARAKMAATALKAQVAESHARAEKEREATRVLNQVGAKALKERLSAFMSRDACRHRLRERVKQLLFDKNKLKAVREPQIAPFFWKADFTIVSDRTVVPQGGKPPPKHNRVWASDGFMNVLFKGKHQIDCHDPSALVRLKDLLLWVTPGYTDLLGKYYHFVDVVQNRRGVLDLAFMEVVWRYSHAVGEQYYAAGLFEWPDAGIIGETTGTSGVCVEEASECWLMAIDEADVARLA